MRPQLPFANLVHENVKRERTWRLIGVHVLTIRFTATHKEFRRRTERCPPAENDGHGLRDHGAVK